MPANYLAVCTGTLMEQLVDEENFNYPNKYSKKLKLLTAAYVENVRLIDNIDIEI